MQFKLSTGSSLLSVHPFNHSLCPMLSADCSTT